MSLKHAKHNDAFGDIPEPRQFGDLWLPPGVAEETKCTRPVLGEAGKWEPCDWSYFHVATPQGRATAARALVRHHHEEHTQFPRGEEVPAMATRIRSRR